LADFGFELGDLLAQGRLRHEHAWAARLKLPPRPPRRSNGADAFP
jgi:hypothetical protein